MFCEGLRVIKFAESTSGEMANRVAESVTIVSRLTPTPFSTTVFFTFLS
jgi:hypothetical protein